MQGKMQRDSLLWWPSIVREDFCSIVASQKPLEEIIEELNDVCGV